MRFAIHRRLTVAATTVALMAGVVATASSASAAPPAAPGGAVVNLQVLNVSDFHGQLDPLSGVGGAAALSAYWAQDRAANPNTLLLTAGDAVGASPPLSSFFQDRPTIDWMNYAGFDADTFGNHNFDAGLGRLQDQIDTADFDYLSANLANVANNLTGVAPYKIYKFQGVKVAVIGVTNPEAPTLVTPGNFGTIKVTDPVKAAMTARRSAERQGADVFIAIGHLGVTGTDPTGAATGPLIDFAHAVRGFDLILGDHTDRQFQDRVNGALVLENRSKGATYAKTSLTYDRRRGGAVTASSVTFVTPTVANVTPDPAVETLLAPYRAELSTQLDGTIGVATGVFPRGGTPAVERVGEAAIGDLVADALRATYGTQIAFTNGGGLRSPLPSSYLPLDTTLRRPASGYAVGPPYDLVTGDVYSVLPFGNQSLTRTVTGGQLWSILEHSVGAIPAADGRFLQISGFRFTYDATRAAGPRVMSVSLNDGTPVPADSTTYTATTNDFTNAGGDGYTMLVDGQGTTRNLMANDVLAYITAQGTITPALDGRIIRLN